MSESKRSAGKKPLATDLPRIRKQLDSWPTQDSNGQPFLASGEDYFATIVSTANFSKASTSRTSFSEVCLERINLSETSLENLRLDDVAFEDCNVANSVWNESSWQRVRISGSRLLGLSCNDSLVGHLTLVDCDLRLAQFRYSRFERARFEGCNLTGADFQGADLRNATFEECELSGANFNATKLVGADVHTSQIEGLNIQPTSLEGLIVSPAQAVQLAAVAGLVVKLD